MAGIPPVKKEAPATTTQIHKIRITLSSRNPKALEKVCAEAQIDSYDGLMHAYFFRLSDSSKEEQVFVL